MAWKQQRPSPARPASATSALMARAVSLDELNGLVKVGRVWAIIDACNEPEVPPKMYEIGEQRAVCLYRGDAESDHADVAPFLAHVDDFLLQWIVELYWKKPWGIFVVAQSDLATLRTHFRKFLTVKDPDGEKMYFRFYDPRILKAFLPSCDDEELRQLFGPLEAYGVGDPDSSSATLFTWERPVQVRR